MRRFLAILSLSFAILGATACTPAPEASESAEEIATLKKRITKLENRMRKLEGRGRAPGGPGGKVPPAKGPFREIAIKGDAKTVVLGSKERRFRLPGKVPAGTYGVMLTFGEPPLTKHGTLEIPKGEGPLTVTCLKAAEACTVQ